MKENLDFLADSVHYVCTKDMVSCEGFVILTLEAINMMRLCCHCYGEGPLCTKLVHSNLHKVSCAVVDLLGCGNHMDTLIQELARFFLGESVLAPGEQDLEPYCYLLRVCRP